MTSQDWDAFIGKLLADFAHDWPFLLAFVAYGLNRADWFSRQYYVLVSSYFDRTEDFDRGTSTRGPP